MAGEIFVGSVSVGVVPDARGIEQKLRDQVVPPAKTIGDEAGTEMGDAITGKMGKAGDSSGGAFEKEFKRRLKLALDSLPKAKVDADVSEADRKVEEIRARIESLHKTGVIDPERAAREIDKIAYDLTKLRLEAKDIKIDFDTKTAQRQLFLLRGLGQGATRKGGALGGVAPAESAIQTASGAAGAGSGLLGNIMNFVGMFGGGSGGGAATTGLTAGGGAEGAAGTAGTAGVGGAGAGTIGLGAVAVPAAAVGVPLLGQALGGAGVAGLGGALAGVGIIGAIMSGKLTKTFTSFASGAKKDFINVGSSFVPVIGNIIRLLGSVMKTMTPIFKLAMSIMSGPLQVFAGTLVKAFTQPAVQKSILAIANAFSQLMKAMTPNITAGIKSFAEAITRMAQAVAANPKAFADLVNFFFQVVIAVINGIAYLTKFANWIETNFPKVIQWFKSVATWIQNNFHWIKWFLPGLDILLLFVKAVIKFHHDIAHWFDLVRHDIAASFDAAVQFVKRIAGDIFRPIQNAYNSFMKWWHTNSGEVKQVWRDTWNTIKFIVTNAWNIIGPIIKIGLNTAIAIFKIAIAVIKTIWNALWTALKLVLDITWGAIKLVVKTAWDVLVGVITVGLDLLTGKWKKAWTDIKTVVEQIWSDIVNFFSMSGTWLIKAGEDIITGLYHGMMVIFSDIKNWVMNNLYHPLINAVKSVFHMHSPATTMIPLGKNIITGIIHGMIMAGKNIGHFVGDIFGNWPKALLQMTSQGIINIANLPMAALQALTSIAGGGLLSLGKKFGGFLSGIFGHGSTGTTDANGLQIYEYLKKNLFGGNKIAAAGATASIWGESTWNPFAVGTGGRGLIGWTPVSTISNAAFSGGMRTQLPAIIDFVRNSGDFGAIAQMMGARTVLEAANIWGKRVERYGINDVHPQGLALASGFMRYDTGGWLPPGVSLAYNLTGHPERILSPDELASGQIGGTQYHAHFDGLTGAAIESHVRTAFQMMSLTSGNLQRQGRRS